MVMLRIQVMLFSLGYGVIFETVCDLPEAQLKLLSYGSCTFNSGICDYSLSPTDDNNWALRHGPIETDHFSISGDHSQDGSGGYALTTGSSGSHEKHRMSSPTFNVTGNPELCLSFWYFAFSAHSHLAVYCINSSNRHIVWRQGNRSMVESWTNVKIPIKPLTSFLLEFEVERGSNAHVGIDDIRLLAHMQSPDTLGASTSKVMTVMQTPSKSVITVGSSSTSATSLQFIPYIAKFMVKPTSTSSKRTNSGRKATPAYKLQSTSAVTTTPIKTLFAGRTVPVKRHIERRALEISVTKPPNISFSNGITHKTNQTLNVQKISVTPGTQTGKLMLTSITNATLPSFTAAKLPPTVTTTPKAMSKTSHIMLPVSKDISNTSPTSTTVYNATTTVTSKQSTSSVTKYKNITIPQTVHLSTAASRDPLSTVAHPISSTINTRNAPRKSTNSPMTITYLVASATLVSRNASHSYSTNTVPSSPNIRPNLTTKRITTNQSAMLQNRTTNKATANYASLTSTDQPRSSTVSKAEVFSLPSDETQPTTTSSTKTWPSTGSAQVSYGVYSLVVPTISSTANNIISTSGHIKLGATDKNVQDRLYHTRAVVIPLCTIAVIVILTVFIGMGLFVYHKRRTRAARRTARTAVYRYSDMKYDHIQKDMAETFENSNMQLKDM